MEKNVLDINRKSGNKNVSRTTKSRRTKRVPSKKLIQTSKKLGMFAVGFLCTTPILAVGSFVWAVLSGADATISTLSHMGLITFIPSIIVGLIFQKLVPNAR
ncbi:hypothetical protein [Paraclostridium bifermentans]|uniref:hypothetical protein n=1 Tax=Paraclostridium bifermentans TaxID=1490 RepID=UPI00374F7E7D